MNKQINQRPAFQIIRKAADLLLKCLSFIDDQNAASSENRDSYKTYYAIDNDIISLYLRPMKRIDYLDVFGEGNESDTARALAFLMSDFLIKSSIPFTKDHETQKSRFFIIPPHDEELLRMLTAIHRDLIKTADETITDALQNLSDIFTAYKQSNDQQKLLDALSLRLSDLIELSNPFSGPMATVNRFALLSDTTFQNINTFIEDRFSFPLFDADSSDSTQLIDQWIRKLKAHTPPNKPFYAMRTDAEVLASLEYINLNIRTDKKQVALITGSKNLFDAASKYVPYVDESNKTFAEMYLRHPQAFLAHSQFFASSDDKDNDAPFKLLEWLSCFFPSRLRPAIQLRDQNTRKFLYAIQTDDSVKSPDIFNSFTSVREQSIPIKDLLEGWEKQVRQSAKMQYSDGLKYASEYGTTKLAAILNSLKNDRDWDIGKLREIIYKEYIDIISKLYSRTVWVGLWSTIEHAEVKVVPELRLDDDYKSIEKYFPRLVKLLLISSREAKRRISAEDIEDLSSLSKDVEEDDKTLYHAHIVHALAFAVKGYWQTTIALANIAITISDHVDRSKHPYVKGREAAYLACVASRRSARDIAGIDEAEKYLFQAIDRENEGCAEDIRFTAERLILETRRYYFMLFCDRLDIDINSVEATIKKLYAFIAIVENENIERIKLWVQRQILTHFFTLYIIACDKWNNFSIADVNVEKLLSLFKDVLDSIKIHNMKPDDDPYGYLIYYIAYVTWGSTQKKINDCERKACDYLGNPRTWRKKFMPYDHERFKLLQRVLDKKSSSKV